MTKERELLRRALEGLENRRDEIADWGAYASEYFQTKWGYEASIDAYDNLIIEIRAHLAAEEVKQEDETVHQSWCASLTQMLMSNPPQPALCNCMDSVAEEWKQEEEPVAWQWLHSGHFRKKIPANANKLEWYPLFLHPSPQDEQRKPLSEEEIDRLFAAVMPTEYEDGFRNGVRFAEKHHGISE